MNRFCAADRCLHPLLAWLMALKKKSKESVADATFQFQARLPFPGEDFDPQIPEAACESAQFRCAEGEKIKRSPRWC